MAIAPTTGGGTGAVFAMLGINAYTLLAVTILLLLISLGCNYYLYDRIAQIKKYSGNLLTVLQDCKKSNKPMGLMTDTAGTAVPFKISRNLDNPGTVDVSKLPDIHKSTTLVSNEMIPQGHRIQIKNCPPIVQFPMPYPFPFDVHESAALSQHAEAILKFPGFSWIPGDRLNMLRILELTYNNTRTFSENCQTFVEGLVRVGDKVPDFMISGEPLPYETMDEEEEEDEEDEEGEELFHLIEGEEEVEEEEVEEEEEEDDDDEENYP